MCDFAVASQWKFGKISGFILPYPVLENSVIILKKVDTVLKIWENSFHVNIVTSERIIVITDALDPVQRSRIYLQLIKAVFIEFMNFTSRI